MPGDDFGAATEASKMEESFRRVAITFPLGGGMAVYAGVLAAKYSIFRTPSSWTLSHSFRPRRHTVFTASATASVTSQLPCWLRK